MNEARNEAKRLPAFANEADEADWWFENRETHAAEFVQAVAEGRVQRNGLARRAAAAKELTAIDLAPADISKAQALAERRGMQVATYLSMLMHEALERESQTAA